jgi:hypothetical protein
VLVHLDECAVGVVETRGGEGGGEEALEKVEAPFGEGFGVFSCEGFAALFSELLYCVSII